MYVGYCIKCRNIDGFTGNTVCGKCGGKFVSLNVDAEKWNLLSNDQMLECINNAIEASEADRPVLKKPNFDEGKKEEGQRKTVYEGNLHKCPNCGEIIKSFVTTCPACGFEFRDTNSSSAVKVFAQKLEAIESKRKSDAEVYGGKYNLFTLEAKKSDALKVNSIDAQKINLIRSYPIPNTKEDVFEFLILASSNINYRAATISERAVSDAWKAKSNQVYQKAKLSFGNDPDFGRIQAIVNDSRMEEKKRNKELIFGLSIAGGMLVIGILALSLMVLFGVRKEANADKQLKAVVLEIEEDLSNGDYDAALIKANSLHYDENLSQSKARQWDEQREKIVELIKSKQSKKNSPSD